MDKPFLQMLPDEQRRFLRRRRDAVPAEAVDAFFTTWAKAEADYAGSHVRVLGQVPGIGEISHTRQGTFIVGHLGVTQRPATGAERRDIEDAVRGGQLSIVLMPSRMLGNTSFDAAVLHCARGDFEPFNYEFRLAGEIFREARASAASRRWLEPDDGLEELRL